MSRELFILLLMLLFSCSSTGGQNRSVLLDREAAGREIRVTNTTIEADIELTPVLQKVFVGETVSWVNQTSYDFRIHFASEPNHRGLPAFMPRWSTVRGKFEKAGTYAYTLFFSSSRTFGNVRGRIVVENNNEKTKKEKPKTAPLRLPEII